MYVTHFVCRIRAVRLQVELSEFALNVLPVALVYDAAMTEGVCYVRQSTGIAVAHSL